MKKISLVYISLSGNTESFVTRLKAYLLEQYGNIEVEKIHIKDLVRRGKISLRCPIHMWLSYRLI